jgi:hypothetical protein
MSTGRIGRISAMVILICLGTWDGWIHLGLEDVLDIFGYIIVPYNWI